MNGKNIAKNDSLSNPHPGLKPEFNEGFFLNIDTIPIRIENFFNYLMFDIYVTKYMCMRHFLIVKAIVGLGLVFLMIIPGESQGGIIYMSPTGSPSGPGDSWATAYSQIDSAIYNAAPGDTIFMSLGTYYLPLMERIYIATSIYIFGGFNGNELTLEERPHDGGETIIAAGYQGGNYFAKLFFVNEQDSDKDLNIKMDGISFVEGNSINLWEDVPCESLSDWWECPGGIVSSWNLSSESVMYFEISDCKFENNQAYMGGAIFMGVGLDSESYISVTNSIFKNNHSFETGGVIGLIVGQGAMLDLEFDSCYFYSNSSYIRGGVVSADHDTFEGSVVFNNSMFVENKSSSDLGSVFDIRSKENAHPNPIIFNNCLFQKNVGQNLLNASGARGGVVRTNLGAGAVFTNCSFLSNTTSGGGVLNGYNFEAINTVFANNYAYGNGAVLNVGEWFPYPDSVYFKNKFANCTFYNNKTDNAGALIYHRYPRTRDTLVNCVAWGNTDTFGVAYYSKWGSELSEVFVSHLGGDVDPTKFYYDEAMDNYELDTDATSWYDGYPEFVDTAGGDFRLKRCSPMINRGHNAWLDTSKYSLDILGNVRILEDTIDLGAFERLRFAPEFELLFNSCAHQPDGEVLVEASGVTLPGIFTMTDPSGLYYENGMLNRGAYEVIFSDSEDCQVEISIQVSGPDTIHLHTSVNPSPLTSPQGAIEILSIEGGVGPYDILWFDGGEGLVRTGLYPGIYSISVTDTNNCQREWTVEVPMLTSNNPTIAGPPILHFLNPAGAILQYNWTGPLNVPYTIFGQDGRQVSQGMMNASTGSISLATMVAGTGIIQVLLPDGKQVKKKFVRQ